jgi:hypothetical protein
LDKGLSMGERDDLLEILKSIEQGIITPEEGLKLMDALSNSSNKESTNIDSGTFQGNSNPAVTNFIHELPSQPLPALSVPEAPAQGASTPPERVTPEVVGEKDAQREITYWKNWWLVPFWIGIVIMGLGAMMMYLGYEAAHYGITFWLAWIPFSLGVVILALSWQSRLAHWLHVRVHQAAGDKPQNINISLPLPLGLAGWFLRNFSHLIPGLRDQKFTGQDLAEMISGLEKSVSSDNPFYVHVQENDGQEVEVFIG